MRGAILTLGWALAGFAAVAIAGDTGRRVAVIEAQFHARAAQAEGAEW